MRFVDSSTHPTGGSAVTRIAPTSTAVPLRAAVGAVLAVLVCLPAGLAAAQLHGLKAAGLTGEPPPNSGLIVTLIATLTSNWLWLVGTGVGLVMVLLAGMLTFGSRSAPDVLFRVIAGVGIILVVIPTALA